MFFQGLGLLRRSGRCLRELGLFRGLGVLRGLRLFRRLCLVRRLFRDGGDDNGNFRGSAISQGRFPRGRAAAAVNQPEIVHLLGRIRVLGHLAAEVLKAHARLLLRLMKGLHLLCRRQGRFLLRRHREARLVRRQQLRHARRLGLGLGTARALGLQHLLEKGLRILRRIRAVYVLHLLHQSPAVGGHTAAAHMDAAQGALQAEEAALHIRRQVNDAPQVIGPLLQAVEGNLHFRQLGLEGDGGVGHLIEDGLGVRHRLAQNLNPLLHRGQNIRQAAQILPEAVRALIQHALAAGEGPPGCVQLVQALGGGVKPALNVRQGVQQVVQTAGEGPVILLQVVLPLAELGDFLQLRQRGGHHQHRQASEGKVVAAHPDGKMLLLPGEAEEEDGPQVAHQLDLRPLRLQGENVVLVEQGRGRQGVIVPGVIAGVLIGHDVQENLHHALLPRQVLCLRGDPVEGIAQGEGPGQVLKGPPGLSLKVEVIRRALREAEGGASSLPAHRDGSVGEVHHLVVDAVVRQDVFSVHGEALYHAALQQVAVIVQRGVVCLVVSRGHAVADGLRRGGGHSQRHRQHRRQGQGGRPFPHALPGHNDSSK